MTHFIVRIPSYCILGDPTVMPTSYRDENDAYKYARAYTIARRNVSTRIDDTLFIYCQYVVIAADTDDEALRIATTDKRYRKMRKEHAKTYIED